MVRTLAMLVRRPDIDRQAFRDHYESRHAPLAVSSMTGLTHYVRNHVKDSICGEAPGFDVLTEFGYASAERFDENVEMLASSRGDALRKDELQFMDKARNHFFGVRAADDLPCAGEPSAGTVKLALLAQNADAERGAFARAYLGSLEPILEHATCCWHWQTTRVGEVEPRMDVATLAWVPEAAFDAARVARWAPPARRFVGLRVEECVTLRAAP